MTKARFTLGRTSKKHHPQVILACLDDEDLHPLGEVQTGRQEFTTGVVGSLGPKYPDVPSAASATGNSPACYMYRPGATTPVAEGEVTDSDPFGWKPLWSVSTSPTAILRTRAKRYQDWIAHSSDEEHKRDSRLLERLLEPAPQVSGCFATQWRLRLHAAGNFSEITTVLELCGLRDIANDLRDLEALVDADPESLPINLESLRHAAVFLLSERQFPYPLVSIAPDGYLWMEWQIAPDGLLGMNFLPSGRIQFVAVPKPPQENVETESVEGTVRTANMLAAIQPFLSRLEPR